MCFSGMSESFFRPAKPIQARSASGDAEKSVDRSRIVFALTASPIMRRTMELDLSQ